MAVVAAETALLALLGVMAVLVVSVLALFNGRAPQELRLARHRALHPPCEETVARDVLGEVHECLRRGDYRLAHAYLLSHTNWFFLARLYLPEAFGHAWLKLRNRVTRLLSLAALRQDWAEREQARLREEALRLVELAAAALGGDEAGEVLPESGGPVQGSREMSAPSARSFSSRRS